MYTVTEDAIAGYTTSVTGNAHKGFVFTNAYMPGKTQINVHKVWDDADDQDGIRPSSVEVTLYRRGADDPLSSITLNAGNGWSGTFSGLDVEGTYFVEEEKESIPDGYSSSVKPTDSAGGRDFTITNSYTPETTSVHVNKVWSDGDNARGARPANVTIRLNANGKAATGLDGSARTLELSSDNSWSGSFEGLPKYDGGHEIVYTVSEDAVENYMTVVSGNADSGYTVTNSYSPDLTSVRVIKRWDDAGDQDGIRPSNVVVRLLADGKETTKALRLSATNGWSGTFGGLSKTTSDGHAIIYEVDEQAVPGYATTYEGDVTSGFVVINSHASEKTSVTVTKEWSDANNQDGIRPDSVTVYLLADGVRTGQSLELNDDNSWTGSFANLPAKKAGEAIRYAVEEEAVAGYTSATSGGATDGYKITNTHTPETVDVSGTKTWVDDNASTRPSSITIKLLANGSEIADARVEPDSSGDWKWSFANLPKYDAGTHQEITYTVSEDPVSGYETAYDRKHLNVTNTYVPTTSVTVNKAWEDNNDAQKARPDSVTVRLRANGKEVATQTLTAKGGWTHTFTNLPIKEHGSDITYTVSEDTVENYTTTITANAANDFTVTNKYSTEDKMQVSVHKVWEDDNNRDGKRPESVTVMLKNGLTEVDTATLDATNNWAYTFVELPIKDGDKKIDYTVTEDAVDGYTAGITGSVNEGYTITNTHTPETVSVSGSKTWDDNNNQDGLRPNHITVRLLANGAQIDDAEVKPDGSGDWTWSFTGLPKYDGGNEIAYTVAEDTVPGYDTAINGYNITNTYAPQKTSVTATKIWDDDGDRDGKRPDSVTVRLKKSDLTEVGTATLDAGNSWTYTFADLTTFENGKQITYTVTEDAVTDYTTTYAGSATEGYTITNTHAPATVDVSGTKTWDDADDQDGIRPSSVTIRLLANGKEVDHKEVRPDANGTWSWNFSGVPANENGKPIAYTVTEDEVTGYETTYDKKHLNVTNAHTPEARSVTVAKAWDDGDNANGKRPTSVAVQTAHLCRRPPLRRRCAGGRARARR